jgi:hypothetical protein
VQYINSNFKTLEPRYIKAYQSDIILGTATLTLRDADYTQEQALTFLQPRQTKRRFLNRRPQRYCSPSLNPLISAGTKLITEEANFHLSVVFEAIPFVGSLLDG